MRTTSNLSQRGGTQLRGVVADGIDCEAIARLAARSGSASPKGAVLLAEVNGDVVAAIGIADGRAVSDPERATTALRMRLRLERVYLRLVFAFGGL